VQTSTQMESQGGAQVDPEHHAAVVSQEGDIPMADENEHAHEELNVLMVGFATGLSIAGVFLVYVVLEFAKLL
jgi:hypothetical protein